MKPAIPCSIWVMSSTRLSSANVSISQVIGFTQSEFEPTTSYMRSQTALLPTKPPLQISQGNQRLFPENKKSLSRHCCGFGWLLRFDILVTSRVISEWVPTCNSVYTGRLYSAVPMGNHATDTMTWYSSQLHSPNTEPSSPCPTLLMLSDMLGSEKYQLCKSLFHPGTNLPISRTRGLCSTDSATARSGCLLSFFTSSVLRFE